MPPSQSRIISEHGKSVFLRTVRKYLPNFTVSHSTRHLVSNVTGSTVLRATRLSIKLTKSYSL
jgi:hypothetical protein